MVERSRSSSIVKLIAAEYFAGIGLVRMGLEACGWKIAFANDFSEKKFDIYKTFYPNSHQHYVVEDIF
jgi:DNA (cytosine-5)-methyltransferase 1